MLPVVVFSESRVNPLRLAAFRPLHTCPSRFRRRPSYDWQRKQRIAEMLTRQKSFEGPLLKKEKKTAYARRDGRCCDNVLIAYAHHP
jgi:hypothetical protein